MYKWSKQKLLGPSNCQNQNFPCNDTRANQMCMKQGFSEKLRLGICQKIYTTKFSDERILHTENALIETFFARDKQRKCIIISNLALFWLKLNSYYESLHLGVCKLAKYVMNCVAFWKNHLHDRRSRQFSSLDKHSEGKNCMHLMHKHYI